MNKEKKMRSLVATMGPFHRLPWWWDDIKHDRNLCPIDYKRIVLKKNQKQTSTLEVFVLFLKLLPVILHIRKKYDFVFTFECDLTSFIIAFWQTVLRIQKPKHVILQFIMREKTDRLSSRLKYAVMKFIYQSVYKSICSTQGEVDYYTRVFEWQSNKAVFVPFHTSPEFFEVKTSDTENYIFSGGSVFRDFGTLFEAIGDNKYKLVIVCTKRVIETPSQFTNLTVKFDIPLNEFNKLIANSRIVVVSLEENNLSAGQTVILQAMTMGKAVIVTRTVATVDYVEDNKTGILVNPYDPIELRRAIDMLMRDKELRERLGTAAKEAVIRQYMPHHYTANVRQALH